MALYGFARLVDDAGDEAPGDRGALLDELSDRVCSGLQVIEHVQDVAEDLRRGRVYMPAQDMRRFGVDVAELGEAPAPAAARELIAFEARRAEELLMAGLPLARTLPPRPALAVVAFVGGGLAAVAAVRAAGCDVSSGAPRASKRLRTRMTLRALVRTVR